ncbi:MAG: RnfABCDGE type electron transport complex subunit D [Thioalkalivibrionaceae bacterium]
MRFATQSSPHVHRDQTVGIVMRQVLYALVPGTLAMAWYFGPGVLFNVVAAVILGVAFEAAFLRFRGRPINPAVGLVQGDYSAALAGWLFALAIPPLAPFWLIAVGMFFAIVVAKQLYGGLGFNPFNPAMVGYVVVLVSFPAQVSLWPVGAAVPDIPLDPWAVFVTKLLGQLPAEMTWDAITMATPLDRVREGVAAGQTLSEINAIETFGTFTDIHWEWAGNYFLVGGIWLLWRRVIGWQIPTAVLAGVLVPAGFFWLLDSDTYASPAFHLFSGAVILGAFFIATDPVSASTTPLGRIIYGLGIGVLIWVIRTFGGYPDAVAFAVLLMNIAVPTIDHFTRTRIYGHHRRGPG